MNEPIISPWLIYLLDILPSIELTIAIMTFLYVMGLIFLIMYKERFPSFTEALPLVVGTMLVILIPPKETMYQMLMAYNVTPEFLLKSGETAEVIARRALDLIADTAIKVMEARK